MDHGRSARVLKGTVKRMDSVLRNEKSALTGEGHAPVAPGSPGCAVSCTARCPLGQEPYTVHGVTPGPDSRWRAEGFID